MVAKQNADAKKQAAHDLEIIFLALVEATCKHDFSVATWSQHIDASRFVSEGADGQRRSMDVWLGEMQILARECPFWTTTVDDFHIHVDVAKRRATIVSNTDIANVPFGIKRKTVEINHFVQQGDPGDKWMLVKHSTMAGMGTDLSHRKNEEEVD